MFVLGPPLVDILAFLATFTMATLAPVAARFWVFARWEERLVENVGEVTRVAQCTSAQLVVPTGLGPPWSGFLHKRDRRWNDKCVQEITRIAVTASSCRVEKLARENAVFDRLWRLSFKRSVMNTTVSAVLHFDQT